jgi:hypothetical protein
LPNYQQQTIENLVVVKEIKKEMKIQPDEIMKFFFHVKNQVTFQRVACTGKLPVEAFIWGSDTNILG